MSIKNDKRFNTVLQRIPPSGIRKFFDLVIGAEDIISLGVGEPDFVTPWHIREEAFYSLERGRTTYTSNWGLLSLRLLIAEYLEKRFKVKYNGQNEILVTVGASEAIDITLRAILNPGDEIIIPEPCFVSYVPLVELAGGKAVTIDTKKTNFVVTAKDIEKKITPSTKAIFLSYPSNPTGTVLKETEMKKIANLVKKYKLWVLTDEIYAELVYDGIKPKSFASLPGMKPYTILISGMSKAFAMTGWRIGYVAAPKDLMELLLKIHQYSIMCAPVMAQYAAEEAFRNGLPEVEKMRKSYEHRKHFFVQSLNKIGLKTVVPEGAFYAFPSIKKTKLSSEDFALKLLKEQKVAVVPGTAFGECGEGFIRCSYATDYDLLKEALKRMEGFVKKYL
ncbi:MAG: aminotransferase class I/II-fold pyridoxal phosphate-dependent enzyme, partial [Candidatus Margulisbacteria bacterium]|nr:aminotransferase class I/II-fold pyridoxal phosphate-dependent enzyme [Candidatus Margulisiibacteriota bacterium]